MHDPSRKHQELIAENSLLKEKIKNLEKAQSVCNRAEREQSILNKILQAFLKEPDEGLYGNLLKLILDAFESEFGVIGYIDEQGNLVCPSMTQHVWDQCRMPDKEIVFPEDVWGNSIWGNGLRTGKPNYSNEPFRVPEGHIPINNCLTAPMVFQGKTIGLLTVANKQNDYSESDKQLLEAISNSIAPVLHARLGRKKAEGALRESERRLSEAQKMAHLGFWYWDVKTGNVEWSEEVFNIFRLDPKEFTPHIDSILALSPWPEDHQRNQELINRALESHEQGFYEQKFLRPDQSIGYYYSTFQGYYNDNGDLLSIFGTVLDITERRSMEEELRTSESHLKSISSNFPSAMVYQIVSRADGTRTFTYLSDSVRNLYGVSAEEAMADPTLIYGRVHEDDIPLLTETENEALRTLTTLKTEVRVKDPSGEIRWSAFASTPTLMDDGSTCWDGIEFVITENKQVEFALKESEERLRNEQVFNQLLLDASPAFIVAFGFDGKILMMNKSLLNALEYTTEEIKGVDYLTTFVPEEDQAGLIQVFKNIIEEGKSTINENRIISRSGRVYLVEWHGQPVIHKEGNIDFFVGVGIDITARKQADAALRESEELYTRLVDSIPDIVIRTDLNGRILFANDYTLQITGYCWQEIEGRNLLEFVSPEDQSRAVKNIMLLMSEGKQGPNEYHLIMKDGTVIPFEVNGDVLRNEDGTPFGRVHVCRNISQRKQAEQEKDQLRERLIQAQKMESVGRLAGGIAHDFNNMLGVILGHVELALEQTGHDQPLQSDLQEILKAARRSADLTRQLLAFASKQTASPVVLDMNETVTGMLKMLKRLIGENIQLTWLPGDNLWPVKIDPSQIDQILVNLCVNARDAISGVGRITIELQNMSLEDTFSAEDQDLIAGEYVLLAVSDDGCGIDKDTRDKIFEPFFTTKEIGKGTGLGLATVYGIVKQNNGFVRACSEPGKLTTFKIYLPRHIGEVERPREEECHESAISSREIVLVVEDEISLLDMTKRMLELHEYKVLTAATPVEAIRLAQEHSGEIHLLITDVVMPEMNGSVMAEKMRSLYPGIKCLFMSGYTADVIAYKGFLGGGVDFIQKPFSMNELITKVKKVLEQI